MGFRQPIPAGQPRTLRSIAQTKGAAPANLSDDSTFDAPGGVPVTERTAFQEYAGVSGNFFPQVPQSSPSTPFKNLKRGG
jgi:hypothetical protein